MAERTPMIAGNWKMNLGRKEARELIYAIKDGIKGLKDVQVLVAPPFPHLDTVREAMDGSDIYLAGQNMHWEMSGAYTGEVSGRMLQEAGCTHVILGHSERRNLFQETSDMVNQKVKAASFLGLIPIICVGETIEQRDDGQAFEVIKRQLDLSLDNFLADERMPSSTILAYEPVWAIGTGRTATPDQADEVHRFIREWIGSSFDTPTAERIRILYGGSVKPDNISALMSKPDIDGALVGGASLKPDVFLKIIRFKE
ncbi:MAG: triose-phosphate isomerase [Thermodesulfobacteriota bacterium]